LKYSNPEIPEGINYSREHPLKEFVVLTGGILALFLGAVLLLGLLAESLADYVPFSAEQKIAALQPLDTSATGSALQSYLQGLAERLAIAEQLPSDMAVQVHYVDDDTVNAFATLGGHIIVFRGLLEIMPDENALAMVLAHEVAHIKYRHPLKGMGRAVVIGTVLSLVSTSAGNDIVNDVLGQAGLLTALKYSRDQERRADVEALAALQRLYGHVAGATTLFRVLQQRDAASATRQLEFFNSHPLTGKRIVTLQQRAAAQGWDRHGKQTQLPADFQAWLTAEAD
jgi:predicted Zn-dependent protease